MTYIDDLTDDLAREVRADLLPPGDPRGLFRLYALLALAKGVDVTAEDVHNAWAVWMSETDPNHRSLRPFAELDADTRAADEPFVDAIRRIASDRSPP